jgi:hypothetical protein
LIGRLAMRRLMNGTIGMVTAFAMAAAALRVSPACGAEGITVTVGVTPSCPYGLSG